VGGNDREDAQGRGPAVRYDFGPVDTHRGEVDVTELARRVGVSSRTVHRWRHEGLSEVNADRCAAALGMVAYELWPEMMDRAIGEVEKRCVRCGRSFLPNRAFQKYCRASCREASFIEARPKVQPTVKRCAWCGNLFESIRASHRRCSQACNRAARYEKHAETERAYQREYNARFRARKREAA
jgi:hypothetical protein